MGGSKKFDKCSQSKKVSGKLSQNKQAVYQLEYQGGTECILTAIFDWKNPEDVTSIWVYNPEGDIEVIEPGKNQTSATFAKNSPLSQGRYRFVLKSEKSSELKYSGNISIR